MAATEQGVWGLQDVRDKQLQSEWTYDGGRELYSAGPNSYGVLGQNNQTAYSSPKQVGTELTWNQVSGERHSLATKTDGTLWAWGMQDGGKLGQNNNTIYSSPRQIPGTTWASISAGSNNSFGIKTDGSLWAWGQNYGNLGFNQPGNGGPGGATGRSSPTQIGTDTNWAHIESTGTGSQFGVKTDGTLWSWGYNDDGNLGQNNKTRYSSPTQVGTDTTWSSNQLYWGTSVNNVNYAIKTDNTLWAWGYANTGDLGQNDRTYQSSPVQIPGSWQSIANSSNTAMGIKTDGTIWSWGNGVYGALGNGSSGNPNKKSSPTQIGTDTDWSHMGRGGGRKQAAIKTDGTLYNCGKNDSGGLGHNNTSQKDSLTQLPGLYVGKPSMSPGGCLYLKEL